MSDKGCCACCGEWGDLEWDHCHDCEGSGQEFRGWTCRGCNGALTEHAIARWEQLTLYLKRHECPARLFGMEAEPTETYERIRHTYRKRPGHGGDRPGAGVRAPNPELHPDLVTVDQIAAFLDRAAGTIRDQLKPRNGPSHPDLEVVRDPDGSTHLFMPRDAALRWMAERLGVKS